ncbi:MAG: hypothetical protein KGL39_58970 [Patescibacteria group bacterium]|nr:hypothetical protein [Patescibacteria group bacterium]
MFVTFQNPGLIPIEAITTLGVNAKETENPIGFFGTGLKYAIAGLLRTGQKITVFRGLEKFEFTSAPTLIRGKEFSIVCMNGKPLGFTTELGKTWETWQFFRELYSNSVLDEDGTMEFRRLDPAEGFTTIVVQGDAFFSAALAKNEVFLSSSPLFTAEYIGLPGVELHPGPSNSIFYRGVRVGKLEKESFFTYNILCPCDLTEDRTLKYSWYTDTIIEVAFRRLTDPALIEKAVTAKGFHEWGLSFASCSGMFYEVVKQIVDRRGLQSVAASAIANAEKFFQENLSSEEALLSPYESRQLAEATAFLGKIGFPITQKVIVVKSLGQDIFGRAKNDIIYLAKAALDKGGNWLAGTILEEHLHITQGFADETRSFQNYLLDLVIKFAREARDV